MAGGAGEPSTKRAKVDETDEKEEEDPLVRRKEEVVRLLERARAKGKGNARAKKELLTLCTDFEAKNEKLLGRLLPELWQKIVDENLQQNDLLAFAMTCRFFRDTTKDLGKKMVTYLGGGDHPNPSRLLDLRESGKMTSHTLGWFQWVCDTFDIQAGHETRPWLRVKGAVYEGVLLNYAAFQGSVEILRWLMEEKGWKLNEDTGFWAVRGGSVKVLEDLRRKGYEFDERACAGAAQGGHLEALKLLRGLDPPCPWDWGACVTTSAAAAGGGHLELLKWARSQDPPCPWNVSTSAAAAGGGHLKALKFLRGLDPPCPWSEWTCSAAAEGGHLEVLKFLRGLDPPCPWSDWTCPAAAREGRLDILKWARSQKPPCPWSRRNCRETASRHGHLHVVDWIDQQEDESDVEK